MNRPAISVLDLAPVPAGATPGQALRHTLDLAQHAEGWGYRRFWLAEHHNMAGIASAATAVVIGYVAAGTRTIRVGAGGIMLPNHAPLIVAEQFGTLESLYPGRIDLGLGRAPGTDQRTLLALRRSPARRRQLPAGRPRTAGAVWSAKGRTDHPGSPGNGPERAALDPRIQPVRRASRRRARPAVCLRLALHARGADAGARALSRGLQTVGTTRSAVRHGGSQHRGRRFQRAGADALHVNPAAVCQCGPRHARPPAAADRRHRNILDAGGEIPGVGNAGVFVRRLTGDHPGRLCDFIDRTRVDEVLVVSSIYDHAARLRSYEIVADLFARRA